MDTGTPGRDIGTSKDGRQPPVENAVLLELRKSKGWGRPRLAKEFARFCTANKWPSPGEDNLVKQIYRLEKGLVQVPDEFYTRLYCEYFAKTPGDLFGTSRISVDLPETYKLRSHKFIPLFVGADAADQIQTACGMESAEGQWFECYASAVPDYGDACHLYVWPFGVAMYHLVEDLAPASLAEVAVWRHLSYFDNMEWAEQQITKLAGCGPRNEIYVLGTYWVHAVPWAGPRLDTALRMLCIPEVLIERPDERYTPSKAHAELVEQGLFRDGFNDPGIEEFGYQGVSTGLASWSGVVYQPLAYDRALTEDDLVRCELAVQSVWSYCSYIRYEVERGVDPDVPPQYGWRFLRALRSRLTTERPTETPQHRSLREAVMSTSGLPGHLAQAVEILHETEGFAR